VTSEKDDELYHRSYNFKWKNQRRICTVATDMPFEFKCLQFPVRLAFAMTINKAQGQEHHTMRVNTDLFYFLLLNLGGVFTPITPPPPMDPRLYGPKLKFLPLFVFVLIGRFGVPIIFLGFWVQPANSLGSSHTTYWLLFNFKVLNILFTKSSCGHATHFFLLVT
jgi:hypothetical protein